MKKKDLAIKYSKWTTTFFYVFGILFVLITIAGMVYSYTNLVQLAHEISYNDNTVKSNFWPIFTEFTMVCLGVLILVVRLNKWPKLPLFRFMFYLFAIFVLLANGYNTSIQYGFNLISIVDLIIQEWPVICYLVFIEIALYVITNVINDRVVVELKPRQITLNDSRFDELKDFILERQQIESTDELESEQAIDVIKSFRDGDEQEQIDTFDELKKSKSIEFEQQPQTNKDDKKLNKKKFLDILKSNPDMSQNAACKQLGVSNATGTNYVRELKESGELDKQDGKWIVVEW